MNWTPADIGVVEILWNIFGGTVNNKGYKELDTHIGCIYGDAITLQRVEDISRRLKNKGFASTNVVYGIGSYTYQYNTRDTFGFALKSTYVVVKGEERMIYKDPVTDDGTKKSLKGLVSVLRDENGNLYYRDELSMEEKIEMSLNLKDLLQPVFVDGKFVKGSRQSLREIRDRLESEKVYLKSKFKNNCQLTNDTYTQ